MQRPAPLPDHRIAGFSLMEIVTALVMISLMVSVAVPSFTGYVERTRTRRALDYLVADVGHARLLAIQQGRRVAVNVSGTASYSIDTLSSAGTWGALKAVDLGSEYRGIAFSGSATSLVFNSRGMLVGQDADAFIRVSRNSVRDSIFISPAGRVYRGY